MLYRPTESPIRSAVRRFYFACWVAVPLLIVAVPRSSVFAQASTDSSRIVLRDSFEFRTTLQGWRESRRRLVLDRRHSIGGRLYDRGIFRHITPKMNREYAHEMLVQRFSSEAFARRRRSQNSLLLRFGSVRRDLLAVVGQLRSRVPLSANHALTVDAVLQQDGQATRPFLEVGYTWMFGSHHALGVRHTFSEYKRDLDPTVRYEYSHRRLGTAAAAVTVQNLYSDLIDQKLGIDPNDRDIIRDYVRQPYLLSFSYTSPDQFPLRGELAGAVQPVSEAIYRSRKRPGYRYRDERQLHFLGALLEYRFSTFSGGLFYKRDASWLRRMGLGEEVSSDYTAQQQFQRFGVFLKGRQGPFRGTLRGFLGAYEDQQSGENYAESLLSSEIDYRERHRGLEAGVRYEPDTGLITGLEYVAFRRGYDDDSDPSRVGVEFPLSSWTKQYWGLGPSDYGFVGLLGYRFTRGKVVFGVGYDIDGDDDHPPDHQGKEETSRFDGAFGRLVLTW